MVLIPIGRYEKLPYTVCPYCNKKSYSAASLEEWICPYCEQKITGDSIKEKEECNNTTPDEQE